MFTLILYGIAIVCLAAASVSAPPANRWLVGVTILLAVVGLIAAATGRSHVVVSGDYLRLGCHAAAPA